MVARLPPCTIDKCAVERDVMQQTSYRHGMRGTRISSTRTVFEKFAALLKWTSMQGQVRKRRVNREEFPEIAERADGSVCYVRQ